ncbi:hypothetical protein MLD38_016292 [Melastoma candidum]|uniref:Uncharacterized protein n=1 Tax=Melastoma candidum TaxID=119954 RepID=A0ACB9RIT0_9MYRT|nr:hypothetical protein MLD38_016292 [Melastoma candidum]
MEGARRSSDKSSDIVVKRRTSSGCLIVRKKIGGGGGAGAGSASSSRGIDLKTTKRQRVVASESESSDDELPGPSKVARRGIGVETLEGYNGLAGSRKEGLPIRDGVSKSGLGRGQRSKLDVFDFDEYEGINGKDSRHGVREDEGFGGRQGFDLVGRDGRVGRELEHGSTSRQMAIERKKNMYFDEAGFGINNRLNKDRFGCRRDRSRTPPLQMQSDKHEGSSQETIRIQGKNGVLKVFVNKNRLSGFASRIDQFPGEGSRKFPISEDLTKNRAKFHPMSHPEMKRSISRNMSQKNTPKLWNVHKSAPAEFRRSDDDWDSEQSDELPHVKDVYLGKHDPMKKVLIEKKRSSHPKVLTKAKSPVFHLPAQKPDNWDSEDSDAPPKPKHRKAEPQTDIGGFKKEKASKSEAPLLDKTPEVAQSKDKKGKRGSGTEKQKLRERIREMLLDAGWTIDYRPRRNRDYQDAVYINPSGTAYWSIIKAYEALQKQLDDKHEDCKSRGEQSAYLISDETLGQLTRKTKKKMEKELKMKQREAREIVGAKTKKKVKALEEVSSMGSDSGSDNGSTEDKLSTFMKQGGKALKSRPNETSSFLSEDRVQDGKSKIGRCTLLARSSDKGTNSETDGFVPYRGKRTLLSWLINAGVVEVGQKVRYMNERRTWVLLEGWITEDGIHCGCCSKLLSVSKFEIHAGSKQSQPFENICVESGDSLLQCQIDAWNQQDEAARLGFHSVESVGDDPNDDTCAICGDGGDLICCDSCPSTFHQNCLHIPVLPPGDWHCPYCICKYCGKAVAHSSSEDNADAIEVVTCNLCEKKFHKSCVEDDGSSSLGPDSPHRPFCSQKCEELFEKLQKYLGIKHDLEDGFSWSIVQRTDIDSELPVQELAKRVESNSKLAIALTIMDECFLPITDRRSRINMIHHVVYSCGSNFNRLNYRGFYTAVLERGDEILSAASLRFHGTRIAEMPFIGTRHIYRRQGMCRRLFSAIESALCSLKVEKLVIPAIPELMDTWTLAFGFTPVEESMRREMRSLNMLAFPGLDLLQKLLPKLEAVDRSVRASVSAERHLSESDNSSAQGTNGIGKEDSKSIKVKNDQVVSVDNASMASISSDDGTEYKKASELIVQTIPENNLANKSSNSTIQEDLLVPPNVEDEVCDTEEETTLSNDSDEKEVAVGCNESGSNTELKDASEVETSEDFLMSECKDDDEKQQSPDRASPQSNLRLGTFGELQNMENIASSDGAGGDDDKQLLHISPSEANICYDGEGKAAELEVIEGYCSTGEPPSLSDTCHDDKGTSDIPEPVVHAFSSRRTDSDDEKQLPDRSLSESDICNNGTGGTTVEMGLQAVENGNSTEETGVRLLGREGSCLTGTANEELGNKTTDGHDSCEPDQGDMFVNSMLQVLPESIEQELSHVVENKEGNTSGQKNSGMEVKTKESLPHIFSSMVEPFCVDGENGASDLEPLLSTEKVDGVFDDALEMEIAKDASPPSGAPLAGEDDEG